MATKSRSTASTTPTHVTAIPAQAALSFLKDTKGMVTWRAADLAHTLNINSRDADQAIALLGAQGYVKRHENEWMTTPAGASVSGSKQPRFTAERVEQALDALKDRIRELNKSPQVPFRIASAVAFGDFLLKDRARVQAADVGIKLVRRKDGGEPRSAVEAKEERRFLKGLRAKSAMLNMRPYAEWMSQRAHRNLL